MKQLAAVALAVFSVACGGSSVTGTVSGKSFSIHDAIFATVDTTGNPATETLVVVMSSGSSTCADVGSNILRENTQAVVLEITKVNQSATATVSTGDYVAKDLSSVSATDTNLLAGGLFTSYDGTCTSTIDATAGAIQTTTASGSKVTLSSYTAKSQAVGDFSVKVGSQSDAVSGHFSATYCAALGSAISGGTSTSTCKP